MKWLLLMVGMNAACIQATARVEVEDYESRIERYTPATLADSGPAGYITIRRRGGAKSVDRYDARVRRLGDVAVLTGEDFEVRVPLDDVEDIEVTHARARVDETAITNTDALPVGIIIAVFVGFFAIINGD